MARRRVAKASKKKRTTLFPPSTKAGSDVPQVIIDKVHQFEEHLDTYMAPGYNEQQLRIDFLNPMLKALGWDVDNERGYAEAYREVVYEDALKIGGASKAPDYGFYIGGRVAGGGRKFFLEAKKPSVAIRLDPKPTFQLRRYAFNANLDLSILTNFRDFLVLDTRLKPDGKEKKVTGVILSFNYQEYPERWQEIASVFSREAILRGSFDKFAQAKRKRGREELGPTFLKDIEEWREILAKDIAKHNPDLTVEDLNFAVQRTIDRILFLRICEDRGIESVGNLLGVTSGENIYPRLAQIFRRADDRYNSGIFHFPAAGRKPDPDRTEPADDLTLDLTIDDQPLKKIIRGLYDTGNLYTTYDFRFVPPEILGQVYEQFLGKVITLSPKGHRVKIEEKPEVRKAGGVYYTPAYIVDYIVRNTVGKLLDGKTPKDAEKIRILDPASGSGSFLIGAYQFLLEWHLRWYIENDPDSHCKGKNPPLMRVIAPSFKDDPDADRLRTAKKGERYDYRLTTQKRKEILLNSIYGVDIDAQAVEVTKLSLLLKVLEGESQDSLAAQLRMFHQRALPDLGKNIKCGNSLIGDDFDDSDLSEEERRKINKFNWQREFPHIFKRGGFDAVIGNPPYVFGRDWKALGIPDSVKAYLGLNYKSSPYQLDMFSIFMQQAATLCRVNGHVGQIVPNVWLTNTYSQVTRAFFFEHAYDAELVIPPRNVFEKIVVDTVVYSFRKSSDRSGTFRVGTIDAQGSVVETAVFETHIFADGQKPISASTSSSGRELAERLLRTHAQLGTLAKLTRGVHPYRTGGYGVSAFGSGPQTARDVKARPYHRSKPKKGYRPFLYGRDLSRYGELVHDDYVRYGEWLAEPRAPEFFEGERIYSRKILADRLVATLETTDSVADQQVYITKVTSPLLSARYVLGIYCSRLVAFFIRAYFDEVTAAFPQIKVGQLRQLPIRTIDFFNESDKAAHDRLVKLVDRMLDLHKQLSKAKSPRDKERIPREIESTDRQIDQLVYELYGLTEDEIRIVEEATAKPAAE